MERLRRKLKKKKKKQQLLRKWLKCRVRKCKEVRNARGKCNQMQSISLLCVGSGDLGDKKYKRKLYANAQKGKMIWDLEMATELNNNITYDKSYIY